MKKIIYKNLSVLCKDNESLLDSFFRSKIEIPFSCRSGTCHACLMQAKSGVIPIESQEGLELTLRKSNHFLPCKCYPQSDMEVDSPCENEVYTEVEIYNVSPLSQSVFEVRLKFDDGFKPYKTGQFINIRTHLDKKVRSYSLTSLYKDTNEIVFHVKKVENGIFSNWIINRAQKGNKINIHYPLGVCYNSKKINFELKIFIATGSGLGASLAIIYETLSLGYKNKLYLYYSAHNEKDLYYLEELKLLSDKYSNFTYSILTQNESTKESIYSGNIVSLAFENFTNLLHAELYLYGNPKVVKSSVETALSLGCISSNIYYDAFDYAESSASLSILTKNDNMEFIEEEKRVFKPDYKMWKALNNGKRLTAILNDFYNKVLVDKYLSPFFKGVTQKHIVGKQYAFLNQIFTGQDCYFGDRPRNAHHWMIVSDKLFDHREFLFKESCINCGLEEPYLSQLLAFDESYREAIVKTKTWPRITNGEIKPIKGFEEIKLDIGSICDGCNAVLEPDVTVHYHDQTGEMFCQSCKFSEK